MWHIRTHHIATSVTSELDDGTEGGDTPSCLGTSKENPDDKPQDELEVAVADNKQDAEEPPKTAIPSSVTSPSTFSRGFIADRSRKDPATIYGRKTGKRMGEVRCLVATHIISRSATVLPTALSLAYIEELALGALRDQVIVLGAEL